MELPISTDKLNIILIGEASPVLVYGTSEHKKDREGKLLYKVPVLIQGTDNRKTPITSITYEVKIVSSKWNSLNAKT